MSEFTELPHSQLETLGHLIIGSANIRPSLHPNRKRRNLRPSQDVRFEHTFTVHVLVVVVGVVVTPALEAVAFSPVVVVIVAVVKSDRKRFRCNGSSSYFYCYFLILGQHPWMHGSTVLGIWPVGCSSGLCSVA